MKTTITSALIAAILLLSITVTFGNVDPNSFEPKSSFSSYYTSTGVDFMIEAGSLVEDVIKTVNYTDESFNLQTVENMSFVQLINTDGELEFQMPIGSDSVHISLENFKSGDYYFNILLDGSSEYTTTIISIK